MVRCTHPSCRCIESSNLALVGKPMQATRVHDELVPCLLEDRLATSVRDLLAPHREHVCWPDHQSDRCPIGRARDVLADVEIAKLEPVK